MGEHMRNMKHVKRMATSKVFLGGLAAVLLYALAGFFLAPYLVQRYIPGYAVEQVGAQASIGRVRVNPFLLSLEASDFRLDYPPGRPIAAFGRLFVDFQLSSLFRRPWTFADVQVDRLDLDVAGEHDWRPHCD